jgi:hypothetical protein
MDKKKMAIIEIGDTMLSEAVKLAARCNDICALHSVVGSQFPEHKKDEMFTIIKRPELSKIWIDPKDLEPNHQKHLQTCAKNRKKRKKRKKKRR